MVVALEGVVRGLGVRQELRTGILDCVRGDGIDACSGVGWDAWVGC